MGQRLGYQNGSFIFAFLKQMKFNESNLVKYNSPEQLDELFPSGNQKGGIVVEFDEIPCMKLFLAKYSKYTVVQPMYKLDGFGFVRTHTTTKIIYGVTIYGVTFKIMTP